MHLLLQFCYCWRCYLKRIDDAPGATWQQLNCITKRVIQQT